MQFVVHRRGKRIVISERYQSTTGAAQYRARVVLENLRIVAAYHGKLTQAEQTRVKGLLEVLEELEQTLGETGVSQPANLASQLIKAQNPRQFELLVTQFEYFKSAYVFQSVLHNYAMRAPEDRFAPELSLDIYRQCADRLLLQQGHALLQKDRPRVEKTSVSPHHKECLWDAFYEICARMGEFEEAFEYLNNAFALNPSAPRAQGLLNIAKRLERAEDITRLETYLASPAD